MKQTEIAYLAGLIDGEGNIHLEKVNKGFKPVITINMTCEKTIKYIHALSNRGTVRPKKVNKNSKPQWRWRVKSNNARYIASLVLPFLITKKIEAIRLINHVPLKRGRHRKHLTD